MGKPSAHPNLVDLGDVSSKTVLIIGAARSGLAAAQLALALGARVILQDNKTSEQLGKLPGEVHHEKINLCFGIPAESLLSQADVVVVSPGVPLHAPVLQEAKKLGLPILGELDFAAIHSKNAILAVSGTNGKTTIVSMLGSIFHQSGLGAQVAGNIGFPLSAAVLGSKAGDIIIAEVSSFQLESAVAFHPQVAALSNISPDHLDRHGSMENYVNLKFSLFHHMGQKDVAVLNGDDPLIRSMSPRIKANVRWFSMADHGQDGFYFDGRSLSLRADGQVTAFLDAADLQVPGRHNIQNALAASAVAHSHGIHLSSIAKGLQSFSGVEHRIELFGHFDGVYWLNDSKGTNPESTMVAISSLAGPALIILGGYDKKVSFDSLAMLLVDSKLVHTAILLGQSAGIIHQALQTHGFQNILWADSLSAAVNMAASHAKPKDTVLFSPACASFDMFSDYEERGRLFKDLVKGHYAREAP